ncbi:MAG: hypothetical protein D6693_04775 [Planctomycetota bacterium]|nr:MAG: hypothetical protein D6693_04775 [Planctomycetota bacterium]
MRRWRTILAVGSAEAVALFLIGSVWLAAGGGDFKFRHILDVWTDPGGLIVLGVWTAFLLACQGAMLAPVRRPTPRAEGGLPVLVSLIAAGLCASMLLSAWVYTALELFGRWEAFVDTPRAGWAMLAMLLGGWALATPALLVFCRRAPRDALVARVSTALFLGTAVETMAVIPIDVMVRRRTDCYCGAGTFLALTLTGSVGLIALGPAVVAPLLMRRRKRWWRSRCEHCGYDMTGALDADRCPECGCGWRRSGH